MNGKRWRRGALGALVETIELAVLSDLLQGLAPEVMQVGGGRNRGSEKSTSVAHVQGIDA